MPEKMKRVPPRAPQMVPNGLKAWEKFSRRSELAVSAVDQLQSRDLHQRAAVGDLDLLRAEIAHGMAVTVASDKVEHHLSRGAEGGGRRIRFCGNSRRLRNRGNSQ